MAKEKKNELAKVEEVGVIPVGEPIPGMECADREDLILPMIYPDGKKGCYWNTLDDSKSTEIDCVLLSLSKGFKLRTGQPPTTECRSFDRVKGNKYGNCLACPNNPGNGGACKPTYEFMMLVEGETIPYVLSIAQATSFGAAQKYITMFKGARKPLFSARTKLGFESRTSNAGNSYEVMTFKKVEDLPAEEIGRYLAIMNEYRFRGVIEDAEEVKPLEDDSLDMGSTPF